MLLLFFFNDPSTTGIYTLSLHDALPIWSARRVRRRLGRRRGGRSIRPHRPHRGRSRRGRCGDRKSTRLNSSHLGISYAVFCLKKKKQTTGKNNKENRTKTQPRTYPTTVI